MKPALSFDARDFAKSEDGATLVEFAVVSILLIFLFFGLIDFARIGYASLMAEKATERAVRMAVVRAPACDDVAAINGRSLGGALMLGMENGTRCSAQTGLCEAANTVSCTGSMDNPTVAAIWGSVSGLMPSSATAENLRFTYHYEAELNRVAAPYNPVVTVALDDLSLDYIFPLLALASAAGTDNTDGYGGTYAFQSMSASLPAETIR